MTDPQTPMTSSEILIRPPLRLLKTPNPIIPPPLSWLERTWTVTHSTLPIWRKAKNVRITYAILPRATSASDAGDCLDDEVAYDEIDGKPEGFFEKALGMRRIRGVDYPDGEGKWHWKGRGWLKVAGGSRWEVLGWGECEGERWVVTWFEKSLFTPAGVDVYCDRTEGISEGLYRKIVERIREVGGREGCGEMGKLVEGEGMFRIKID
ncbi:hypothetical protein BJ875DRAFT_11748 [Amylocarpus encephaloides]|uniref:Uncharacterized protein n=1 Tax=Amylocarpus encephaloides TaxID=45428 RepID=A0A9P7YK38_9HELO|nr:hypothetical protein BJ875DRAFT_11748 [Amylocarpus encephaloides]